MHYTLCDMIFDLVQNSVEAGAAMITVTIAERENNLAFTIEDNGKGMDRHTLEKAKDPFYTDGVKHPRRTVGLGIPFLLQTAQDTGGSCDIASKAGRGTKVRGNFDTTHIDTPPLGDMVSLVCGILTLPAKGEVVLRRLRSGRVEYEVERSELLGTLGDLENAETLMVLRAFVRGLEEHIKR